MTAPMAIGDKPRLSAAAPNVRLMGSFEDPFDLSVAAARTCYMPRVVTPSEVTEPAASPAPPEPESPAQEQESPAP